MTFSFLDTGRILPRLGLSVLGLVLMILLSASAAGQDFVSLSPEQEEAIDWAQDRGELLYRYDQAAWHGTDAFLEDFDEDRDRPMMRGYVVTKGEGNALDTVFYGEAGDGLVEVARYSVDGDQVIARTYYDVDSRPSLSPLARRLAEVRQVAIETMFEEEVGLCADANPNTVALPPDENGIIEVYILTPPITNDSYPLGGHYRFSIDESGEVVEWRRFLNSCFALSTAPQRSEDGESIDPTMLFVTHLLDPQPTEVHFFASHYFPIPLVVGTTDNDLAWTIAGGRFLGAFEVGE